MPAAGTASRKPADTAFKQQRLKAWQPLLTPKSVVPAFFVVAIIFIPVGAIILAASASVKESELVRYDNIDACAVGQTCSVELNVGSDMDPPVYMYYELDNFYQNHRRYVKSRSDDQLRGKVINKVSALEDCNPLRSAGDSGDPSQIYNPCGLIAASQFNDTFTLINEDDQVVPMDKNGIAWKSDRSTKFKAPSEDPGQVGPNPDWEYTDVEDEDFIVWMRVAGLPRFKKLHRVIREKVPKGTYTLQIDSRYDVEAFSGAKRVMLSTTTWVGGKNDFLGWAYVVTGLVCLVLGAAFLVKHQINPRELGDTRFLVWNK